MSRPSKELIETFRHKLYNYQARYFTTRVDAINEFCDRMEREEVKAEEILELISKLCD